MSGYVIFPTPKPQPTLAEQVAALRRRKADKARAEKRRLQSGPRPVEVSGARYRSCEGDDCLESPCDRQAYARDPLARAEGRVVWVCRNRYMRSWRRLRRLQGLHYDTRHI